MNQYFKSLFKIPSSVKKESNDIYFNSDINKYTMNYKPIDIHQPYGFSKKYKKEIIENNIEYTIIDTLRSLIYNILFHPDNPISTTKGFKKLIESVPNGSKILDVGCGDGLYYTDNTICDLIKDKNLIIKGIDIDSGAVSICNKRIAKSGLTKHVSSEVIDLLLIKESYDVVLFMESFPVIPRIQMKKYTSHALTISPKLFMFHNLVDDTNISKYKNNISIKLQRWIKPKIVYVSLVDFGEMTTISEMQDFLIYSVPNSSFTITVLLSSTLAEAMRFPKVLNVGPLKTQYYQYFTEISRNRFS